MCEDCRIFYKKYADLKEVDRPSTVPLCLSKASASSPQSIKDEQENDGNESQTYGIRTRGSAGRKDRRQRTPTILDIYGNAASNNIELKTPHKSELIESGNFERRTTPQRSAKFRKRSHRGSSSGYNEVLKIKYFCFYLLNNVKTLFLTFFKFF